MNNHNVFLSSSFSSAVISVDFNIIIILKALSPKISKSNN
ncbi:hypothetical protein HOLDEFILI_00574 [Holdemania filiformis DSM 12042]|uniref:Uncharacterized protein n=1 Tax=Holdemania filiformis DSM 12042 TaxID=545696 RepID=B9Y442_9FIRM|nr:hypothetical protein HOLDEFILI_00574 [Holdemania filiformis DSM 12042]